mmetsp:Transcript_139892/g.389901  ORF Transcript_139892/g.389901 Transcript_139892/m.389901 type:complete len:303 (-) Transcript_139892:774-1682(-)
MPLLLPSVPLGLSWLAERSKRVALAAEAPRPPLLSGRNTQFLPAPPVPPRPLWLPERSRRLPLAPVWLRLLPRLPEHSDWLLLAPPRQRDRSERLEPRDELLLLPREGLAQEPSARSALALLPPLLVPVLSTLPSPSQPLVSTAVGKSLSFAVVSGMDAGSTASPVHTCPTSSLADGCSPLGATLMTSQCLERVTDFSGSSSSCAAPGPAMSWQFAALTMGQAAALGAGPAGVLSSPPWLAGPLSKTAASRLLAFASQSCMASAECKSRPAAPPAASSGGTNSIAFPVDSDACGVAGSRGPS